MRRRAPAPPSDTIYAGLMARAGDAVLPVDQRVKAAMAAGDLASSSNPNAAIEAYRAAARLDPLDGRAAIAAGAQLARLGALDDARALGAEAFRVALDESVRADAAFLLGEIALGAENLDEAADAFQAAEQIFDTLHKRHPTDKVCLHAIARLNLRLTDVALIRGNVKEAAVTLPRAAAIIDALQRQLSEARNDPEAEQLAADARACIDRQVDLSLSVKDLESAQDWITRLLPLAEHAARDQDPAALRSLASTRLKESQIAEGLGDVRRAIAASDQALGRMALAQQQRSHDTTLARELVRALKRRAELDLRHGQGGMATALTEQAITRLDALLQAHPTQAGLNRERASLAVLAGDAALRAGDHGAAEEHFKQARAICAPFEASGGPWRGALAIILDRLGDVALAQKRPKEARFAYSESLALRRTVAITSGVPDARSIAVSASKLGEAALAQGDLVAARAAFHEGLTLRVKMLEQNGGDALLRRQVALSLERVGLAALASGELQEARLAFEDELTIAQADLELVPEDPEAKRFVAIVHSHLCALNGPDAAVHRHEGLRLLESLMARSQATAKDIALRRQLSGH